MLDPAGPVYVRPGTGLIPWLSRFLLASTGSHAERSTALIRDLSLASLDIHADLAREGLETGFERRGILNVYETDRGFADGRKEAETHGKAGIRYEILTRSEAQEFEPALGTAVAGAVLYPDEAHCDPSEYVKAVSQAAVEAGATVSTGVEVLRIRRSKERIDWLETTVGDIRLNMLVVAAGAWTQALVRDLNVFVPVQGGKGYHLDLAAGPNDPHVPVFMQELRVIATPFRQHLRLAGTLELTGLDLSVSRRRVEAIIERATRVLPGLQKSSVLGVWRGLRPCAPDGVPVVGSVPAFENLVLATGHAMLGLTLAPITGRLVAQLLNDEKPAIDVEGLSPGRFRPLFRAAAPRWP